MKPTHETKQTHAHELTPTGALILAQELVRSARVSLCGLPDQPTANAEVNMLTFGFDAAAQAIGELGKYFENEPKRAS